MKNEATPKGNQEETTEKNIDQVVDNTDMVVAESKEVAAKDDFSDLSALPSLTEAKAIPIDLMEGYWTPETIGESKRVYFDKVAMRQVLDSETGEVHDLLCAYFYEEQSDKSYKTVCNGSRRLVGAFESGKVKRLTPFEIKYLGEKKNSTNSFKSHDWSVKPLQINV